MYMAMRGLQISGRVELLNHEVSSRTQSLEPVPAVEDGLESAPTIPDLSSMLVSTNILAKADGTVYDNDDMGPSRLFIAFIFLLLSSLASAQVGLSPWRVTYSSEDGFTRLRTVTSSGVVFDSGNLNWWFGPDEVEGGMGGATGAALKVPAGGSASGWVMGTVTIHFHWRDDSPLNPPPSSQWVRVSGVAGWGGNEHTSGAVFNGFADPSVTGDYYEYSTGDHILQKRVSGRDFFLTYFIRAEVHGTVGGLIQCNAGISAAPTMRNLDLDTTTPGPHYKKELSGNVVNFVVPSELGGWMLQNPATLSYWEAVSTPVDWRSDDDLAVVHEIDLGLPTAIVRTSGGTPPEPYVIGAQGFATSDHIPEEIYRYSHRGGSDHMGETLPTWPNGWDIYPMNAWSPNLTVQVPWYHAPPPGTPWAFHMGDGQGSDTIIFDYKWSDGAKGTAIVNITYHPETDNNVPLGKALYLNPRTDWSNYNFRTGSLWSIVGVSEQEVGYTNSGVNLKAYSVAVKILTAFLKMTYPEFSLPAQFIAAVIGEGLGLPQEEHTYQPLHRGSDFYDADAHGRVSPANWRDLVDNDTWEGWRWRGQYVRDYVVAHWLGDRWNSSGYVCQERFQYDWYTDMMAEGSTQRFWYDYFMGGQ